MRSCLIMVDVQNDFLPGGALPVEGGEDIIEPLVQVARTCDLVVASRDWHPPRHTSFDHTKQGSRWPPHCVQDTPGARIYPKLRKLAAFTISKGMDPEVDAYSAFAGHTLRPVHDLTEVLQAAHIERVIVGGLALDYCVRWTALDANALGFETVVPLDCTQALDNAGRRDTLEAFERAGVRVVNRWREIDAQPTPLHLRHP